jgi:hypothetical protein
MDGFLQHPLIPLPSANRTFNAIELRNPFADRGRRRLDARQPKIQPLTAAHYVSSIAQTQVTKGALQ